MHEWWRERMSEWKCERLNVGMKKWMKEWTIECRSEDVNEWLNEGREQ